MKIMKYYSIYPSHLKLDGGAMFGIVPKPLWSKKIVADELNRIEMNCRMFLIQTQSKNIIIDLGVGDYHGEKFDKRFGIRENFNPISTVLEANLKLTCNDITDVIVTHLHFDHVGGLGTKDGLTPLFPNATFHLHKKHFDYSLNPTPRDKGSFHKEFFEPLVNWYEQKDQLNWLTQQSNQILIEQDYELNFITSHGHTPFQVLPYDKKVIYMGDLLPTSHHLNIAWTMGYDLHPGDISLERLKIYDWIIENDLSVIFDHDKDFWGAKLLKKSQFKYEFKKLFESKSNSFEEHLF